MRFELAAKRFPAARGTAWLFRLGMAALLSAAPWLLCAQQQPEQQGVDEGNYHITQSIEFGGRLTSLSGNLPTYDTFVNLQQGARLLGFNTEMRSLDHHGLIDRLYFSNFGYGGDPNNVSRLRISKNKWYNFDGLFRRDENFWDYSLLANPINPASPAFAGAPAGFTPVRSDSPHTFTTRRRLSDYDVTLLPDSTVRFRLGYSYNVTDGPSFSTIHQGTEQLLLQNWKTTVNTYRFGVDFKALPRTNISYDEILSYFKGDSGFSDHNQLFSLSNGQLVDLGVAFNAGANQPCANTFGGAGGTVSPACSAYFNYLRLGRTRTSAPTEQLSLQSNYFQNVDLSARYSYTGGDLNVFNYSEQLAGRESRTNLRNSFITGPVVGSRVASTADFGATWHISKALSFLDSLHFSNFHNPAEFDSSNCAFFSPNLLTPANLFGGTSPLPLTCIAPPDGVAGTPAHAASSGPDVAITTTSQFLKQDEKTNLAEFEYQYSPHFGGHLGYRYRSRTIAESAFANATFVFFPSNPNGRTLPPPFNVDANGNPVSCPVADNRADGSCLISPAPLVDASTTPIHEHAGVFGIWLRSAHNFRVSFDTELMSADNTFTRISPRQTQEYRVRSNYKPVSWFNLSASVNIWEGRDNVPQINNLQHNRAYGFSASFEPGDKFAVELGYDYNDVFSQILICFVSSAAPAGLAKCPAQPGLVEQLSTYTNTSNYGYFNLTWTPIRRLTALVGANLTGTSGNALLVITPSVPTGPLDSKYLHPSGGLEYRFAKNWVGKASWDYYAYHEDPSAVTQDIFAPRNFRGDLVTLSVRYAF